MKSGWNRLPVAVFLLVLAACAAQRATVIRPAISAPEYFSPAQIDSVALLEPPPAARSEAAQRDLRAILDAQRRARVAGTTAAAVADAEVSCARFAEALTPNPAAPGSRPQSAAAAGDGAAALAFATRAALQAAAAARAAKAYWHRPRPFIDNAEVERLGDVRPDIPLSVEAAFERDHTSYPSGHAAFGAACAIVLTQMVPEQRTELFVRGRAYGESRVIVGAHYPTDVEAGRIVGTAAAAVMLENPQFKADLHAARTGLRMVLGLPQAP